MEWSSGWEEAFGYEYSCQVRRLVVKKLASLQQASGRLHDETWAGRAQSSSLPIFQVVEIAPGCPDTVYCLPLLFLASVSPGPGREVRNWMSWTLLEKTTRSGLWWFGCALGRDSIFFALAAAGDWVRKGSFFTAWAALPLSSCSCSYAYGQGTAVGPQSGRCCSLLTGLWRAIAPLMKPWCAVGDVPIAANLNLYRGRKSRVGWHDNEQLFGERGDSTLLYR